MIKNLKAKLCKIFSDVGEVIDKYHSKSSWINITAPLTSLLTLSIYLSVGIVSADYKDEVAIYLATFFIEGILLLILCWEFVCCVGSKAIRKWAGRTCVISAFTIGTVILLNIFIQNLPDTRYYAAVTEVYGIPAGIEDTRLSKNDLSKRAGYWEINDRKYKNHMTLTYVDAYNQAEIMQEHSTLYNMSLFQYPVRVEIDYERSKNKDKYRSYGEESFEAARKNDFREPVRVGYYSNSDKLLLELEKNNEDVFEITTYSSKDKPQLLNSTLLRIPAGQQSENDMTFQQIEVTYNSAGLPEIRKLKSRVNLYGVSGEKYIYDENHRLSTLHFLNSDGIPACNNLGIMTIDFKYSEDGNLQSICYYSDEEKTEKTEGFYKVFHEKFLYSDDGNLVERRQLGREGSPCYDSNKVCKYKYTYDAGELREEAFYGRNNSPVYMKMQQLQSSSVKFGRFIENGSPMISVLFALRTNQDLPGESIEAQNSEDTEKSEISDTKEKAQEDSKTETPEKKEKTNDSRAYNVYELKTEPDVNTDANNKPDKVKFQEDAEFYLDLHGAEEVVNVKTNYTSIYYKVVNGCIEEMSYRDKDGNFTDNEQGCSMRKFAYDCKQRIIREEFFNAEGNECIVDEGYTAIETAYMDGEGEQIKYVKYLDANGEPVNKKKTGYAIIRYKYGGRSMWEETGNSVISALWREKTGQNQYAEKERCIAEYYLDKDENPVLSYEEGYAGVKRLYNENGFLIGEAYYDKKGEPTYRTDYGVAKILYEYSEIGNRVCDQYFDKTGAPVNRIDTGYARIYREFKMGQKKKEYYEGCQENMLCAVSDKQTGAAVIEYNYNNGQMVEESYYDINRRPVLRSDLGCAKRKYEYANGKVCRQSFYDESDNLTLRKDLGVAIIQYEYDDAGRNTFTQYYGIDELPVISTKYKCAGFHYNYDEVSGNEADIWYIGTDGNVMVRQDLGYAHVHYEYDSDGNIKSEAYLDADEEPALWKEGGFALYTYEYDKENEKRTGRYFINEEEPVLRKDYGYAWFEEFYENGKCRERRYYDTEDELVLIKDKGYARIEYEYNEFGQCISELFYGTDGDEKLTISPEYKCAGFLYDYDEKGRQISIEYVGEDGKTFIRGDRGFALVEYEYDDRGFRTASRYYDATKEQLIISTMYHCAGFDYEYDERGNEKRVIYIGLKEKMMVRRDYGNAQVCKRYDDAGRLLGEAYYDKDGNPAIWRGKGYASFEYTLENGNSVETRFYDIQHNLVQRKDTGYAIEKAEYDESGRCIARLYYGSDEKPVFRTEYNCAGIRYAYDERGNQTDTWYIGADGGIMLRQDLGYAHVEYVYDDEGRMTEEAYYDIAGERTACLEGGYASCQYDYNEEGDCSEKRYYDTSGYPVLRKDTGYALVSLKYDALGRCVKEQYYDIWKEPVISTKYHCYGFEYKYDKKGNWTEMIYLDAWEKPMIRSDCGVARVHKRYDSFGNLEGEDYFIVDEEAAGKEDNQWKPAVWKGKGYSSFTNQYDAISGKCIETHYKVKDNFVLSQEKGYAIEVKEYDEFGQLKAIYYKGTGRQPVLSNESCAGFKYNFNEKGEQTDTWYLGLNGRPMVRTDVGYAHIKSEYDEMGQEVKVSYLDKDDFPAVVKDGGYSYSLKTYLNGKVVAQRYYDKSGKLMRRNDTGYAYYINVYENGNWVEGRYYDEGDNLVQRTDLGYAVIKKKYNAFGQCIFSLYYDATGEHPVISNKYNCAGFRYAYDKKGNQTDTWYIGLDGKLLVDDDYGYAHIHSDYNETGMEIRTSYFDEEEKPAVYIKGGYASREKKYKNGNCMEERYYNTNGEPVLRKDEGYAMVRYQYNDLLQEQARYYYGLDGQYIEGKEQCAGYWYNYDERGNQTYIWRLDTNGTSVRQGGKGGEIQYRIFDEFDNLIWDAYFVYDGNEYHHKDFKNLGYFGISYSYENSKLIEKAYKNVKSNYTVSPEDGYAILQQEYNNCGLLKRKEYHDAKGKLIDVMNGDKAYAKIEYVYDASGNCTKRLYYNSKGKLLK